MCKMVLTVVALTLLALQGSVSAHAALEEPVAKVVTLMEDMASKIQLDAQEEQQIYDKFACWCEETTQRKATAISEAKTSIERLTNRILELKGSTATHKANIEDLNRQSSGNYAGQESSKKIRDRQEATYQSKRADLESAIGAMEGAIKILEGAGEFAQTESELLTVGGTIKKAMQEHTELSQDSRTMVDEFLADPAKFYSKKTKRFSGIQQKNPFGDYAPGSGAIQGILKGMYDQFTMDLERANVEEAQWQKQYEDLYVLKGDEAKTLATTIANKEQSLSDDGKELSEKTVEKDETQTQMVDDEKFFMQTKKTCKDRADNWAERTRLRTEELAGVNKAISILNDDDAKETFGKANSMFLQTGHDHDHTSTVKRDAYNAVAKIARRKRSIRMSAIAAMIETEEGGHFNTVIDAVQKMLNELREEENDDIKLRDYCAMEEDKAHGEVEDLQRKMRNTQGGIDRLNGKKKEAEDDLKQARQDIEDTETAMSEALSQRNEENQAFRAGLKDDMDAVELIGQAKESMQAFGKKNGFLQASSKKEPEYDEDKAPEGSEFTKEYKGRGEGGGIVSILSYLKEDLENEILTTKRAEGKAADNFLKSRKEGQKVLGAVNAKVVSLQTIVSETDLKITDEQADKDATEGLRDGKESYIDSLKPKCEWIKADFDSRRESRNEEMQGLQEAKILLAGKAQEVGLVAKAAKVTKDVKKEGSLVTKKSKVTKATKVIKKEAALVKKGVKVIKATKVLRGAVVKKHA